MNKTGNHIYLTATRIPFSTASVLPAVLGLIWCLKYNSQVSIYYSILATLGVWFLHLGANTLNDYFDWDKSDKVNRFANQFSGGSRRVLNGIIPKKIFFKLSLILFFMASVLGLILIFKGRPWVLLLGTIGGLTGILYSVYPFSFQSRGLGEILIFFAFGPLITLGTGYVATGLFNSEYFLIGIPNGLSVLAILVLNEFPDFEADKLTGKRNLVVRLGRSLSRYLFLLINLTFYISIVGLIYFGIFPILSYAVFAGIPLSFLLISKLWKNYNKPMLLKNVQKGTIAFQSASAIFLTLSFIIPV